MADASSQPEPMEIDAAGKDDGIAIGTSEEGVTLPASLGPLSCVSSAPRDNEAAVDGQDGAANRDGVAVSGKVDGDEGSSSSAQVRPQSASTTLRVNRPSDADISKPSAVADKTNVTSDAKAGLFAVAPLQPGSPSRQTSIDTPTQMASPKPKIRIKLRVGQSPKKEAQESKSNDASVKKTPQSPPQKSITAASVASPQDGGWLCLKCIHPNGPHKLRCGNCKGWKGGKRENFVPPNRKEGEAAATNDQQKNDENAGQVDAVNSKGNASSDDDDDDAPLTSLKSSKEVASKEPPKKKKRPSVTSSSKPPVNKLNRASSIGSTGSRSSKSHAKTKLFSGTMRSVAAAHRSRQIHVPPIGSPGLLMIPTQALFSSFPDNDETSSSQDISKWLHNGMYLKPNTVFAQSMITGGYTLDRRKTKPHRGSSTERTVGDMFDSDVGGLYLHFPELIPTELWEKRLGDEDAQGRNKKKKKRSVAVVKSETSVAAAVVKSEDSADAQMKQADDVKAVVDAKGSHLKEPVVVKGDTANEDGALKDQRLVDMVILGLSKIVGTNVNGGSSTSSIPAVKPDPSTSNLETKDALTSRKASSDLTLDDLPKFTPPYPPQTRKRCRPHEPMSFLDMLPISLTSTYPLEYVAKRRAYAKAVGAREVAIVESQEAADDIVDNKEKYEAHKEAWDRMFEYQKAQIAKREAAAMKIAETGENSTTNSNRATANGTDSNSVEKQGSLTNATSETVRENSGDSTAVKKGHASENIANEKKVPPPARKKEDPMDYMPPRPEPPPPEHVVQIPEIPIPPSPPPVVEYNVGEVKDSHASSETIRAPKLNFKMLQHLDPTFFLPSMEGRYFGLLSNDIADPQFTGANCPGIRGITSGGGTGLATSYVGGGRGAAGLVSGVLRGGVSSVAAVPTNTTIEPKVLESKEVPPKESPVASATDLASSLKKKKKKRPSSEGGNVSCSASDSAKKTKRVIPLATGDRNTSATEIASGSAGDDFPSGWIAKTYRRAGGETVGKTDRFWFSPGRNIRFRAKKHAMTFIDILKEPSVDGDEDKAAEVYKARGHKF